MTLLFVFIQYVIFWNAQIIYLNKGVYKYDGEKLYRIWYNGCMHWG